MNHGIRLGILLCTVVVVTGGLAGSGLRRSGSADRITGVVLTEGGEPIEGATVEARDSVERLGSRITPADGTFSFSKEVAERAIRLEVRRIGYESQRKAVDPDVSHYEFRLVAEPVELMGLVVEAQADPCADRRRKEDREARALWAATRQRYHSPLDTVGIATYFSMADSVLPREEIGPLGVPQVMADQRGSSSQFRFSRTKQIRREGYAFRVRRTEAGRSFDSWSYPPLQADFAPHFMDDVFGRLHRFHLQGRYEDGWVLEFCPRSGDANRPSIRGSMLVTPDTTLAWVEWRFRTPEPNEQAGGRIFLPDLAASDSKGFPLPTESLFWRRLPDGRYYETHLRFEEWIVAPGDTVPFLPKRK